MKMDNILKRMFKKSDEGFSKIIFIQQCPECGPYYIPFEIQLMKNDLRIECKNCQSKFEIRQKKVPIFLDNPREKTETI